MSPQVKNELSAAILDAVLKQPLTAKEIIAALKERYKEAQGLLPTDTSLRRLICNLANDRDFPLRGWSHNTYGSFTPEAKAYRRAEKRAEIVFVRQIDVVIEGLEAVLKAKDPDLGGDIRQSRFGSEAGVRLPGRDAIALARMIGIHVPNDFEGVDEVLDNHGCF